MFLTFLLLLLIISIIYLIFLLLLHSLKFTIRFVTPFLPFIFPIVLVLIFIYLLFTFVYVLIIWCKYVIQNSKGIEQCMIKTKLPFTSAPVMHHPLIASSESFQWIFFYKYRKKCIIHVILTEILLKYIYFYLPCLSLDVNFLP